MILFLEKRGQARTPSFLSNNGIHRTAKAAGDASRWLAYSQILHINMK